MFLHTVTKVLSEGFAGMVDMLSGGNWSEMVRNAIVNDKGHILDKEIIEFREVKGLLVK